MAKGLPVGVLHGPGWRQCVPDLQGQRDFGFDHDTCVTCINNLNTVPVCLCKGLGEFAGYPNELYKNMGQCVKALR